MKQNQKKVIITVIALLLVLLAVAGSYAFFTANTNNDNRQEAEIKTANMSLRFADNDGGISATLDFGEQLTKEFLIENTGDIDAVVDMYWRELKNTYLEESLTYKLEYKTSIDSTTYTELPVVKENVPRSEVKTSEILAKGIEVPSKTTYYYKLTITLEHLDEVDQTQDFNAKLSTWFDLKESKPKPTVDDVLLVLQKNGTQYTEGSPNFARTATGNAGLYSMADDYTATTGKQSYYFRGAVPDNYVKFGGFYWRIIRINGDGSLRMIYDGKQAYDNGTANDLRNAVSGICFSLDCKGNDAKYTGYMFGPSGTTASSSAKEAQTNTIDSNAKVQVDTWYKNNIVTNVANGNKDLTPYLADSIFCNDRSLPPSGTIWWSYQDSTYSNLGWGRHATPYGAYDRLDNRHKPTFICPNNTTVSSVNDKFTVKKESGGNGALTYPVGLITADEISAAGGLNFKTANQYYYLYKSSNYFSWSLSPLAMDTYDYISVFSVSTTGSLRNEGVNDAGGAIAPVINIKPEFAVTLEGKGTMTEPYMVPNVN